MSIEEIIRAWKADEQDQQNQCVPENPVGYELSDEDLEQVVGGREAVNMYSPSCCGVTETGVGIPPD